MGEEAGAAPPTASPCPPVTQSLRPLSAGVLICPGAWPAGMTAVFAKGTARLWCRCLSWWFVRNLSAPFQPPEHETQRNTEGGSNRESTEAPRPPDARAGLPFMWHCSGDEGVGGGGRDPSWPVIPG